MTNQKQPRPVTNAERARQFVAEYIDCPCGALPDAAEKAERLLNEAEDRGREEAESRGVTHEPLINDAHALDLLRTLIREGLRPIDPYVAGELLDARANGIAMVVASEIDAYHGASESTDPMRGRAGS